MAKRWASVDERFNSYTFYTGDCIVWTGATTSNGYGQFSLNTKKMIPAHRYTYERLHGPVTQGLELDHLCRNRACVNPGHLEMVTHKINTLRGYGPAGINARKTHCPKGHLYAGRNIRTGGNGRECRICHNEKERMRYARKKNDPPTVN
jgi:HNH endonuclease